MDITTQTLTDFFAEDGQFRTKSGVLIRIVNYTFCLTAKLKENKEDGHLFELYDELYSAEKFMALYEIHSLADLEGLNVSGIWVRYLAV
jgi:hypothetical protein